MARHFRKIASLELMLPYQLVFYISLGLLLLLSPWPRSFESWNASNEGRWFLGAMMNSMGMLAGDVKLIVVLLLVAIAFFFAKWYQRHGVKAWNFVLYRWFAFFSVSTMAISSSILCAMEGLDLIWLAGGLVFFWLFAFFGTVRVFVGSIDALYVETLRSGKLEESTGLFDPDQPYPSESLPKPTPKFEYFSALISGISISLVAASTVVSGSIFKWIEDDPVLANVVILILGYVLAIGTAVIPGLHITDLIIIRRWERLNGRVSLLKGRA